MSAKKRTQKKVTNSTMAKFAEDLAPNPLVQKFSQLSQLVGKQVTLPINNIGTNENIRSDLGVGQDSFRELVLSIKEHGILQNIVVELREREDDKVFELVCIEGHRRIAACKELGLETVPCFLKSFESKQHRTRAALACTLKEDIHPLDRAAVYQDWITAGSSVEEIATQDGKNIKTIKRFLKILDWSQVSKELVKNNKSAFPTWWLFQKILQKSLTTKQIDSLIRSRIKEFENGGQKTRVGAIKATLSNEDKAFIEQFSGKFGSKPKLKQRSGKKFLEVELTPDVKASLENLL